MALVLKLGGIDYSGGLHSVSWTVIRLICGHCSVSYVCVLNWQLCGDYEAAMWTLMKYYVDTDSTAMWTLMKYYVDTGSTAMWTLTWYSSVDTYREQLGGH